jgi:hypothetical protein
MRFARISYGLDGFCFAGRYMCIRALFFCFVFRVETAVSAFLSARVRAAQREHFADTQISLCLPKAAV